MPKLFSYGTLQQDNVQLATFGRLLHGRPAQLVGFKQQMLEIRDAEVVRASGKTHHPIVSPSENPQDRVAGSVFDISAAELEQADRYEVDDYRRVEATLDSGERAWVYIAA
ncbi:gamma-glutamylcyclotransferase family protein [Chromobacterium sp. IIBBL 290-4]|uniref:gamma-glutamylcyclotransferase family protein n=1 Tax=Chromobacterium sp. IIBBL 290-4 TaxID=2953890 RepID=UPI0020B75730|nr:gamma-glutamylcyclotransferase family protein [Chromobacterium sp. IIBBL 290-4]UTH75908.1 gamma-glutamylcyclotransferase [Chromobacterium sp. IIBBL 290-4]